MRPLDRPAKWLMYRRAGFGKKPCQFGWHIWVLSLVNGHVYRRMCEHCGKLP